MSASVSLETSRPIDATRARICASSLAVKSSELLPAWILRELATIEVPMWPGMTTEHLMCGAFSRRSVMQRLGEALHRELGGAVGGVRHVGAEARPRSR